MAKYYVEFPNLKVMKRRNMTIIGELRDAQKYVNNLNDIHNCNVEIYEVQTNNELKLICMRPWCNAEFNPDDYEFREKADVLTFPNVNGHYGEWFYFD